MIFQAPLVEGKYRIAKIETEDEEGLITEDWWTLPATQTIRWYSEDGLDTFFWPSFPKDQLERFLNCQEFKAKNREHLLAKDLELYRKCITVSMIETEEIGASETLDNYIKEAKDTSLITNAQGPGRYFVKDDVDSLG